MRIYKYTPKTVKSILGAFRQRTEAKEKGHPLQDGPDDGLLVFQRGCLVKFLQGVAEPLLEFLLEQLLLPEIVVLFADAVAVDNGFSRHDGSPFFCRNYSRM